MFKVRIDGADVDAEQLLGRWGPRDRLGIVVHEPFGALGASHLIQLVITAFYDVRPQRRAGRPMFGDPLAVYPEVYLFHVGCVHGDHSSLDVFPPRKEVVVAADPAVVLEAINDRGISWLAVPDAVPADVEHSWKEPAAARDSIVAAFAYSASGVTAGADLEIAGLTPATEANATAVLDAHGPNGDRTAIPTRFASSRANLAARYPVAAGVPVSTRAARAEAQRRRRGARCDGLICESYRRLDVVDAIRMLVTEHSGGGDAVVSERRLSDTGKDAGAL